MAPPQILSLLHLSSYGSVAAALADARTRPPPLVEPHTLQHGAERMMCYPGDPQYPVAGPVLTHPTRLLARRALQPPRASAPGSTEPNTKRRPCA
jgi:hypothetical protein